MHATTANQEKNGLLKEHKFEVVALAASAGGLQAISEILSQLPETFAPSLLIVQHLDPKHISLMDRILRRITKLKVEQAEDRISLQPGHVYIAPPNKHMLVDNSNHIHLSDSEPVHFVRPAADPLFESVASQYGPRAIAVILTGTGVDGAQGVKAIKNKGGVVLVQDTSSSEYPGMPKAAIETGAADYVLPITEIAPKLIELGNERINEGI